MLQAFPCATQPHVMTLVGVSGPAVAWEIASARIPPFISKPNKQKSSGSSLCWFAAFIQQHNGPKDMHKRGSDLLVAKPLS